MKEDAEERQLLPLAEHSRQHVLSNLEDETRRERARAVDLRMLSALRRPRKRAEVRS